MSRISLDATIKIAVVIFYYEIPTLHFGMEMIMMENEMVSTLSAMLEPMKNEMISMLSGLLEPIIDEMQLMHNDIHELRTDVQGLKTDVQGLKTDVQELKEDVQELKVRVEKIELTQENVILPRLQNIESCYLSTYERYKNSVDDYETIKQDVSLLKIVVAEHSEKLQEIS